MDRAWIEPKAVSGAEEGSFFQKSPMLSIVTTAYNEVGNVEPFLTRTLTALRQLPVESEIIYIDDGSTDGTSEAVEKFIQSNPNVTVALIRHPSRLGITAAVEESVAVAKGKWLCLLPADLESLPNVDIPILYRAVDDETDMVMGIRQGRKDGKFLSSRLYNLLNGWLFGVKLSDANWIKLIRRETMVGIRLRSNWHRYMVPILAHYGCRIKEVETPWYPRLYGSSKFGLKRFPGSLADMLTIKFLLTYGKRPFLFFGWVSAMTGIVSLVFLFSLLLTNAAETKKWVTVLVLFAVSLTVGLVSLGIGLVAEICNGTDLKDRAGNVHGQL